MSNYVLILISKKATNLILDRKLLCMPKNVHNTEFVTCLRTLLGKKLCLSVICMIQSELHAIIPELECRIKGILNLEETLFEQLLGFIIKSLLY